MKDNKNIIQKITSFFRPDVSKLVQKGIDEKLSKVTDQEVVRFSPVTFNTPNGLTPKSYSLGVNWKVLRDFADNYPIVRACIEFRKSQITHLDWAISPIEITDESVQDEKNIENSKKIKEMFRHPTGKKDSSFTNWIKQIMEDMLVVDAVAIYRRRNRKGGIIGYLPVDGTTFDLKLEEDGTTPEPPAIAYVQKINGQQRGELTTDDLIYSMMTPRVHNPYGLAPIESLILTITTALKLQTFNLSYLSEGNIPEGFVTLPRDIASSRDQLKEWQDSWDAMLSGDPRFQRKLKFLPEGMKYDPTVTPSDMTFERFEKWLLQVTCSVFGIHPSAIGFNFDINRAAGQVMWEAGRERGLFPTALFLKEIMDRIIQEDMGFPELQFVWSNIDPTNKKEEAQIVQTLINTGLMAVDEWRLGEGLKPIGVKDPFIMTPVGPMFLKDLVHQSEMGQLPVAPYKPVGASAVPGDVKNLPIPSQAKADIADEIKKWKKVAINDIKEGRDAREFKTDVLDIRTYQIISSSLKEAKTKEEVVKIFDQFSGTGNVYLKVYDEVNNIIQNGA